MALTLQFHSGPDYDCAGPQSAPLPVDITAMICVYMCNFLYKVVCIIFDTMISKRYRILQRHGGWGGLGRRSGADSPVFRE